MHIKGQGHFFTIYFQVFVCFVLYLAKISGENLQDHWSSGYPILFILAGNDNMHKSSKELEIRPDPTTDCRVSCL